MVIPLSNLPECVASGFLNDGTPTNTATSTGRATTSTVHTTTSATGGSKSSGSSTNVIGIKWMIGMIGISVIVQLLNAWGPDY